MGIRQLCVACMGAALVGAVCGCGGSGGGGRGFGGAGDIIQQEGFTVRAVDPTGLETTDLTPGPSSQFDYIAFAGTTITLFAWRSSVPPPWELAPILFHSDRGGEQVIGFLRNLRRHIAGKVIVIWDGLPPDRSGQVNDHIRSQRHWLTVERFPAYAPELNPVEGLWSALNAKHTANYSPDTLDEVGGQLRAGIRRLRRQDTVGLNFIKHAKLISKRQYLQLCKAQ